MVYSQSSAVIFFSLNTASPEGHRQDDLANPPQTMAQCLQQAQDATVAAIEDGQILMDVEFPPLAADLMDDPNTSAGAIAASRRLQE